MTALPPRIIGEFHGPRPGPLVLVFGGMHGNEVAGVTAIQKVLHLLNIEPAHNPTFAYAGRFIGLRGNRHACAQGVRFIDKDLNRLMTPTNVRRVLTTPLPELRYEDWELHEIAVVVDQLVQKYKPERMIVLDLHTTTADGGIFSIATDDPTSVELAKAMYAPVITGMLKGIQGTTLHYFSTERFLCPTTAVTFEGGQHHDPQSVDRCVAAIINLLRSVQVVRPEDVGHRHDEILIDYSKNLPKVAKLRKVHRIYPADHFHMRAGFHNFQPISKGTLLAHDRNGPIHCPFDATLLMPLYQNQGEDGFFLIEVVEA